MNLANDPGYFTWYELITTDVTAAAHFYRDVVGWGTQGTATSQLPYVLFTAGEVPAAGLMELPEAGRKMGAMPRWMGYVGVADVPAAADRIKRLGGAVYVPPTDTNIGRISVVADPRTATFGVIERLQVTAQLPQDSGKLGRIGWHELFADDLNAEVAFYCQLFGWQKANTEIIWRMRMSRCPPADRSLVARSRNLPVDRRRFGCSTSMSMTWMALSSA